MLFIVKRKIFKVFQHQNVQRKLKDARKQLKLLANSHNHNKNIHQSLQRVIRFVEQTQRLMQMNANYKKQHVCKFYLNYFLNLTNELINFFNLII